MNSQPEPLSILLIDDNIEMHNIFEIVMSHHDLPCSMVSNAQAALKYLQDHTPTIVVIDLVLPDLDGYGLFQQIRKMVHSKFIATTAYHTSDTEQQVLSWGFDGYLPKPLSPSTLIAYLRAIANE